MGVNFFTTIFGIIVRSFVSFFEYLALATFTIVLTLRDLYYTFFAIILPYRPRGGVIKPDQPGFQGLWPEYRAPTKKDSRSPCPGLNALANHGILSRDGCHLTYKEMSEAIQHAFNLSPTLGDQLTSSAYLLDQGRGWIDLHDLNALGVIQHDASFTRPDIAFCPDQSYPHKDLVEHLLSASSNGKTMTLSDMAYFSGLRRAECRASNGEFSLTYSFIHKFFGSGNAALLYAIFGGVVEDLRIFLSEERIPDGWEPKTRYRVGHTILFAQKDTLTVEFNIDEKQKLRPGHSFLKQ